MGKTQQWFAVDKEGLADLVASKGKVFVLHELLQNAWDCPAVRKVEVSMVPIAGKPFVSVAVLDDDPDGFTDLTHAYTLFASSKKKSNPDLRGRFNLGEKLVLSLCTEATISSTTGTVRFDHKGRHQSKIQRAAGTLFHAVVRMTREEYAEVLKSVKLLIPPDYIETFINGEKLEGHEKLDLFAADLPTVVSDDGTGVLRDATRSTTVRLWCPKEGEAPHIYEMGIPVVELGGGEPWHIDVEQKVPLSMERDNVTPAYLRRLRSEVLNRVSASLTAEQSKASWVTSTLGSFWVDDVTVRHVVDKRFGSKAVIADLSDREGEHMAVAQGYTVVPGGAFPADAWERIRETKALLPAGQVTPSPKPYSPDGTPLKLIDHADWSPEMVAFEEFAVIFSLAVAGLVVAVNFTIDRGWKFNAAYSKGSENTGSIVFNEGRLGQQWFAKGAWADRVELLIHELGHHWGQHLDSSYHEALCRLGRVAVELSINRPRFFTEE